MRHEGLTLFSVIILTCEGINSLPRPFTFFLPCVFLCCFSVAEFPALAFPSSGFSSLLARPLNSGLCDWLQSTVLLSSDMLSRQYVLRMSSSCRLSSSTISDRHFAAPATESPKEKTTLSQIDSYKKRSKLQKEALCLIFFILKDCASQKTQRVHMQANRLNVLCILNLHI